MKKKNVTMNFVIVESPSKCQKIKYFLETSNPSLSFDVRGCCGHFREIVSIDPNTFDVTFQIMKEKRKYIQTISRSFQKYSSVELWIATDNDREGEAIGWHLCTYLKKNPYRTKRLRFNEISFPAIQQAFQNPSVLDPHLIDAQITRQILDRWIGFTFSPLVSSQLGKKWLSAGRCQTPTLKLVLDNQHERDTVSDESHFEMTAFFSGKLFECTSSFSTERQADIFVKKCKTQSFPFDTSETVVSKYPPKPFKTSTLQQYCSTYWKWSPTFTMKRAQNLYEQGFITYHRTDSIQLSNTFQKKAREHIESTYGTEYVRSHSTISSSKQGAHEGIRPICLKKENDDMLYKLILKQTLQSLMTDAKVKETEIKIHTHRPTLFFVRKIQQYLFLGFLRLDSSKTITVSKEVIPKTWRLERIRLQEKLKHYVSYLSESQIISSLEKKGIGRPSTFASFVHKILQRRYVEKDDLIQESNRPFLSKEWNCQSGEVKTSSEIIQQKETQKLILSELGEQVLSYLYEKHSYFFNYEYTKTIESILDQISEGTVQKNVVLKKIQSELNNHTNVSSFSENPSLVG